MNGMRKPRRLVQDAKYHVSARVNHQEMLLDTKEAKQLFLDIVERAKLKYTFRIENFSIMGNHFHFIIQPLKQGNLSKIMQWILGVFAMTYNRIHGLSGHFWQSRFFSRIIFSFQILCDVFAYIDNNPVKACLAVNPWEWAYGALAHHRSNNTSITDALTPEMLLVFPNHSGLLLPVLIQ